MEFIKKIQHKLHDRMLKRQMAESKPSRSSMAFNEAHSIGILFDATALNERKAVLAYAEQLKKQDKKVKLLGYLNEKENQPNFTFDHFANKDLSWIGKNKSVYVEDFVRQKFDLLFCLSDDQPLVDIAARSMAKLRVGPAMVEDYPFDLMIDKESMSQQKFIEQINFFIKKINPKTHV